MTTKRHTHTCRDCLHSMLLIYREGNPVCSVCRETGEKDVASRQHYCDIYEQSKQPKTIEKVYEAF